MGDYQPPPRGSTDPPDSPVGAPSELADDVEVPAWFANVVTTVAGLPIIISVLAGMLGLSAAGCCLALIIVTLLD